MARYVQGKDGKFTGSVGDGKHAVPTPADPAPNSAARQPPAIPPNHDYNAVFRAFQNDVSLRPFPDPMEGLPGPIPQSNIPTVPNEAIRTWKATPDPNAPNVWREGNNLIEQVRTADGQIFETIYPNRTPAEFGKWARPNDEDWSSEEFLKAEEQRARDTHEALYARRLADYNIAMQEYEVRLAQYEFEAAVMCPQCQESVKSRRHALGCLLPNASPEETFVFIGPPRKPVPPEKEPFVFRKPSIDRDPVVRRVRH